MNIKLRKINENKLKLNNALLLIICIIFLFLIVVKISYATSRDELLNLPLCSVFEKYKSSEETIDHPTSQINSTSRDAADYNCVKKCDEFDNREGEARGVGYAIHGVNCIRFIPVEQDLNEGVVLNGSTYYPYVERGGFLGTTIDVVDDYDNNKVVYSVNESSIDGVDAILPFCHQINNPNVDVNCVQKKCYDLHDYELGELRDWAADDVKNCGDDGDCLTGLTGSGEDSCDIGGRKCYEFRYNNSGSPNYNLTKKSFPYIPYILNNQRCVIHACKPKIFDWNYFPAIRENTAGELMKDVCEAWYVDDIKAVITNNEDFEDFQAGYKEYIAPDENNCSNVPNSPVCKIAMASYSCTKSGPDNKCDTECGVNGSDHSGSCYKVIDCNDAAANIEAEIGYYKSILHCGGVAEDADDTIYENTTVASENLNSWFYRPKPATAADGDIGPHINNDSLCYTAKNMEDNGWGWYGFWIETSALWTHNLIARDIIPGHCTAHNPPRYAEKGSHYVNGTSSVGYMSIKGTKSNLLVMPEEDALFNDGYVIPNYSTTNDGDDRYDLRTCVRFSNTGRLRTYGTRECGVECAFGSCYSQWCGFDRCQTLTVYKTSTGEWSDETKKCGDNLEQDTDEYGVETDTDYADCIKKVGDGVNSYLRLRASGYGDRMVCVFLDYTGATAHAGRHMGPNSTTTEAHRKYIITDKPNTEPGCVQTEDDDCRRQYCSDRSKSVSDDCSGGWDGNSSPTWTHYWRTAMRGIHISEPGYTDNRTGMFYEAQECAYIPLRRGPPRFYKIATHDNSSHLFRPLLIMRGKEGWVNRDGNAVDYVPSGDNQYYNAVNLLHFQYPNVTVSFGDNDNDADYSVDIFLKAESNDSYDTGTLTSGDIRLTASVGNSFFTATIFVKKENNGFLCLYEKTTTNTGSENVKQISCIERRLPSPF